MTVVRRLSSLVQTGDGSRYVNFGRIALIVRADRTVTAAARKAMAVHVGFGIPGIFPVVSLETFV